MNTKSYEALKFHISTNPASSTFMYEDELPDLPVPSLDDTLQRYLEWNEPLLNSDEKAATKQVVTEFLRNEGPVLQEKLKERASTRRNWMEDWWLHYAYLCTRTPLIPYQNMAGPETLHMSIWPPTPDNAFKYGAMYILSTMNYFNLLREERIRPQMSSKGQKLSMDQFRRVYNTCRIPGPHHDTIKSCWKTKREGPCPTHIIVLCHGHIWRMEPLHSNGEVLRFSELESQLRHIRATSDSLGEGPGVGALTCDAREEWAKNRQWLQSVAPNNAALLEEIESAVFAFVLDDSEPTSISEVCWEAMCGDTANRWADKSVCTIVTRNGYVGNNNDHTPYDAMVLVFITDFQRRLLNTIDIEALRKEPVRPHLIPPRRIQFTLDSSLTGAIERAIGQSITHNDNLSICFKVFQNFGKNGMKECKVHPDSMVQVCLQLAYYRTYGKLAPTYETATTRQFFHGRTETLRSCTSPLKKFVCTMDEKSALDEEKIAFFQKACSEHDRLMRACQQGQGVDRHMLGLYLISAENGDPPPPIFTDPAFFKTGGGGNYVLSTSTIGYTDTLGGVAPMVPHGYGVFYSMLPDKIYFFVSSFKDGGTLIAPHFAEVIAGALEDVKQLMTKTLAKL